MRGANMVDQSIFSHDDQGKTILGYLDIDFVTSLHLCIYLTPSLPVRKQLLQEPLGKLSPSQGSNLQRFVLFIVYPLRAFNLLRTARQKRLLCLTPDDKFIAHFLGERKAVSAPLGL